VRRSTGRILAGAGYEIVEAATGQQALDAVRNRRLDAVVLDIQLPDISGFVVCETIMQLSNGDLPVLHMSGVAVAVGDRVRALHLGADGLLSKPVDPADLIATLAAILRARRGGRAVADHGSV
jgi:DNA-binding response OmpR family regulator